MALRGMGLDQINLALTASKYVLVCIRTCLRIPIEQGICKMKSILACDIYIGLFSLKCLYLILTYF